MAELPPNVTREIVLNGLDEKAGVELLQTFNLTASPQEFAQLTKRYQGHTKSLQFIAALIQDDQEYQGNIAKFLQDRDWLLIQEIEKLFDESLQRLSESERICLSRISIYQTSAYPLTYAGIAAQMAEFSSYELKENIIRSLKRRQLLSYDKNKESYRLHCLIQEKAYQILSQNPQNHRNAHRQASRYFCNLPLKPESEWQNIEDIKSLIIGYYHACQAEDWEAAKRTIYVVRKYLTLWGYSIDKNPLHLFDKNPNN